MGLGSSPFSCTGYSSKPMGTRIDCFILTPCEWHHNQQHCHGAFLAGLCINEAPLFIAVLAHIFGTSHRCYSLEELELQETYNLPHPSISAPRNRFKELLILSQATPTSCALIMQTLSVRSTRLKEQKCVGQPDAPSQLHPAAACSCCSAALPCSEAGPCCCCCSGC